MPLPAENTAWPPVAWAPAFDRYRLDEALWLNDTERLAGILAGGDRDTIDGRAVGAMHRGGRLGISRLRRWAFGDRPSTTDRRTNLPIPIGASLADLSAAQLMSEAPRFRAVDAEGKTVRSPLQERLDIIGNSDDAHMTLIEGAQTAAALGAVVLKASWDLDDPDRRSVYFDTVGADCAVPIFNAAGRLLEILLFTEYDDPRGGGSTRILRHIERHAPGIIEHALFLGTPTSVGKRVPLDTLAELAPLASMPNTTSDGLTVQIATGISRITAAYWRNRPSRIWRRHGTLRNAGRSDFELVEPLIDAYSEAWASMMRDVRLGKARLLVPLGMLEVAAAAGQGASFDTDREIYAQVGGLDPEAGTNTIKDYQAAIRWQEHMRVLAGLKTEILDATGWSMSSYGQPAGLDVQGGVTATEIVDRTTKSERTRDEKALYFKQPAQAFVRMLLELDGRAYPTAGGGIIENLSIDFPDVSQVDPEKQARTFLDLSTANAISIEQSVRERRPNWDDDKVGEEVDRILTDLARKTGPMTDPTQLGLTRPRIDLTDPAGTEPPPAEPAEPEQPEPLEV